MQRIGIISDTHGLLRPQVSEILGGCSVILHGGDIDKQEILDSLKRIAPTYAVRGNTDGEWATALPESLLVELYGIKFYMTHNRKSIPKTLPDADIIIFGHSHIYEEKRESGRLFLNPGSCGPKRFVLPVTMAVLKITNLRSYDVERIEIPVKPHKDTKNKMSEDEPSNDSMQNGRVQNNSGQQAFDENIISNGIGRQTLDKAVMPPDIKKVIISVMKDTDHKIPVDEIAKKNGISKQLAEQICRLYLTHPGVSADGIMAKMGI